MDSADAIAPGGEPAGIGDFGILVDMLTAVVPATTIPTATTPLVAEPAETGQPGEAATGKMLPLPGKPVPVHLPQLSQLGLLELETGQETAQPAGRPQFTAEPDAAPRALADLVRLVAKQGAPGLAPGSDTAPAEQTTPRPSAAIARPVDAAEAVRHTMSPELRSAIDRAANVLARQMNASPVGAAKAVAEPVIRSEVPLPAGPIIQPASLEGSQAAPAASQPVPGGLPASSAPSAQFAAAATPHDFEAVVDRLSQARDQAQPGRASLAVRHEDFGQVSLRLESAAAGLKIGMSSADPDFAPAAQIALAERALADRVQHDRALPERGERMDRGGHSAADSQSHQSADQSRTDTQQSQGEGRKRMGGQTANSTDFPAGEAVAPETLAPPTDGELYA